MLTHGCAQGWVASVVVAVVVVVMASQDHAVQVVVVLLGATLAPSMMQPATDRQGEFTMCATDTTTATH